MSQGDDLEFQGGTVTQTEREQEDDGGRQRDHAHDATASALKSPGVLGISEF